MLFVLINVAASEHVGSSASKGTSHLKCHVLGVCLLPDNTSLFGKTPLSLLIETQPLFSDSFFT